MKYFSDKERLVWYNAILDSWEEHSFPAKGLCDRIRNLDRDYKLMNKLIGDFSMDFEEILGLPWRIKHNAYLMCFESPYSAKGQKQRFEALNKIVFSLRNRLHLVDNH